MNYHMKRLAYLPMLLSLLLGSCTLMMEDIDNDDAEKVNIEEVGFDEPYTLKTEFGDVTFQYGDSTRVLHQEAMNFLVKVEGDSILYFTDNIPKELLIPVGQYVSMGCNEHLRHGLCSRVESLTQQNGMYRMVTSRMPNSKVFKQMDVDVFVNYDQQMGFDPENYLEEQGMINENGDTDSVFTDWSMMGEDVLVRKRTEIERRIRARQAIERLERPDTRWSWPWEDVEEVEHGDKGDKDYTPEDENIAQMTSKSKEITIFSISTNRIAELFKLPTGSGKWKGKLYLNYHEQTTLRHIQKVSGSQDYVSDTYDETPYIKMGLNIGWGTNMFDASETKTLKTFYKKLYDKIPNKIKSQGLNTKSFMVHIPLPVPIPVEFFVRIMPNVTIGIDIVGELEMKKGLGTIHKEIVYENGKLTKKIIDVDDKTNNSWSVSKLDFCGSFTFDAKVEALLGFATTGGNFGLGAGAEVGAKFNAKISLPFAKDDGASFNVYLKPKIKAFAQSPSGKEWGSIETTMKEVSLLGPMRLPVYPTLMAVQGRLKLDYEGDRVTNATPIAKIKVSDLNVLKYGGTEDYVLYGAFFREDDKHDPEWVGTATPQKLKNKKGETYEFSIVDAEYKRGTYYSFRPYIENTKLDEMYVTDENDITCKLSSEQRLLSFKGLYQTGYTKLEDGREVFDISVRGFITELEHQGDLGDWGVEFEIQAYDRKDKTKFVETILPKKKFPVTKIIKKRNIQFDYTLATPGDVTVMVTAKLYYTNDEGKEIYAYPIGLKYLSSNPDDWGGMVTDGSEEVISL